MKICFIIEAWKPFYAGGQVHAWELCKRLVKDYKCSIDVYTRKLTINGKRFKRNETYFNGKLKIIRSGIATSYDSFLGRLSWVVSVFFKGIFQRFDIIHGQANLGGLPAKLLSIATRAPVVFTVHGSGVEVWDELGKGFASNINAFVENFLQTKIRYDAEISVDRSFLRFKNKNKPIVIPNGVDFGKFDNVIVSKEKKYFKIIFVGRLHPQKGLKYLVEAFHILKGKLKKMVKVHIIGSGVLNEYLIKRVRELGLQEYFVFRGKVFDKELIKEYKSSQLFVLPSIFEGQPLTLLEAWAAKLPVLATDVGDNKRFIVNGKNGWLVKAKDAKILAKTIQNIATQDDRELKLMGLQGYNMVKKNYSWDLMANKTFKLYRKLETLK